jgi:uracil-DNA glycosylase
MSDMYLYFANGPPFVYLLVGQVAASSNLRAKGYQATNLLGSWILHVQLPFN